MRKHTPGQWSIHRYTRNGADPTCPGIVIDSYGKTIATVWNLYSGSGHQHEPGQLEANARLIAAAPDLLEACENILGMIYRMPVGHHFPDDVDERCDELRAAIAKAKGNQ